MFLDSCLGLHKTKAFLIIEYGPSSQKSLNFCKGLWVSSHDGSWSWLCESLNSCVVTMWSVRTFWSHCILHLNSWISVYFPACQLQSRRISPVKVEILLDSNSKVCNSSILIQQSRHLLSRLDEFDFAKNSKVIICRGPNNIPLTSMGSTQR